MENIKKSGEDKKKPSSSGKTKNKKKLTGEQLKSIILDSLEENKAEEIVEISLAGKTAIADYMLVANGRSTRQVAALARHIDEILKKNGLKARIEGFQNADWVLIDAGDVIAHIFRPEVRAYYSIEKIWQMEKPETPSDFASPDA